MDQWSELSRVYSFSYSYFVQQIKDKKVKFIVETFTNRRHWTGLGMSNTIVNKEVLNSYLPRAYMKVFKKF